MYKYYKLYRFIFPVFLLLFPLYINAQPYERIVDTTKEWSIISFIYNSYYIRFQGDTIIESKLYYGIYTSTDSLKQEWNLIGYAREDTTGKVFFRDTIQNEGLVYDMGLNPGDTIYEYFNALRPFFIYHFPFVVDTIRFKQFAGKNRKFIYLYGNNQGYVEWIEGIGSLDPTLIEAGTGLSGVTGPHLRLLCFSQYNSLLYMDPHFTKCYYHYIPDAIHLRTKEVSITLFPNPVTDISVLKMNNHSASGCFIEIFSQIGTKIRSLTLSRSGSLKIFAHDFLPGIYIYRVRTENNTLIYVGKFVIANK